MFLFCYIIIVSWIIDTNPRDIVRMLYDKIDSNFKGKREIPFSSIATYYVGFGFTQIFKHSISSSNEY